MSNVEEDETYVEPLGAYKPWTIKEIPDDEFAEQWALFEEEKARRDAMAEHGRDLDDFLKRHRALTGMEPLGRGEPWFEPSDVFDAYPLGAIVEHEDQYYRSKQHANMQPPTVGLWWEKTAKPKEPGEGEEGRDKANA